MVVHYHLLSQQLGLLEVVPWKAKALLDAVVAAECRRANLQLLKHDVVAVSEQRPTTTTTTAPTVLAHHLNGQRLDFVRPRCGEQRFLTVRPHVRQDAAHVRREAEVEHA